MSPANIFCSCIEFLQQRAHTLVNALAEKKICFRSHCVDELQTPQDLRGSTVFRLENQNFFALGFFGPVLVMTILTLFERFKRDKKAKKNE